MWHSGRRKLERCDGGPANAFTAADADGGTFCAYRLKGIVETAGEKKPHRFIAV